MSFLSRTIKLRFTKRKSSLDHSNSLLIFFLIINHFRNFLCGLMDIWFAFFISSSTFFSTVRPIDTWPFESFLFGKRKERWDVINCYLWIVPKLSSMHRVSCRIELISCAARLIFINCLHQKINKIIEKYKVNEN